MIFDASSQSILATIFISIMNMRSYIVGMPVVCVGGAGTAPDDAYSDVIMVCPMMAPAAPTMRVIPVNVLTLLGHLFELQFLGAVLHTFLIHLAPGNGITGRFSDSTSDSPLLPSAHIFVSSYLVLQFNHADSNLERCS
jgi:hypothetical protein